MAAEADQCVGGFGVVLCHGQAGVHGRCGAPGRAPLVAENQELPVAASGAQAGQRDRPAAYAP